MRQKLHHEANGRASLKRREDPDTLICFSHLRWDFVFQRPQHLMSRFARTGRVLMWEEPRFGGAGSEPRLDMRTCPDTGVVVVTPELGENLAPEIEMEALTRLLNELLAGVEGSVVRWYYTPMMLPFSEHVAADCVVYDCMDELANFKNAPPSLLSLEQRLLEQADVVFTGGHSLYEAKRGRHANIHPFPSSVDVSHFASARGPGLEPADQAGLPRPRFGFYGVVDERINLDLLSALADALPNASIVVVGPVIKIAEDDLPRRVNLHYLGGRDYADLPAYLRGWDVALMPFAINEATRFISPTKTPEYLAAGCPVVSTPITDVVRHYGELDGVIIADTPEAFVAASAEALALARHNGTGAEPWRSAVDAALANLSWDNTQSQMAWQIARAIRGNVRANTTSMAACRTDPAGLCTQRNELERIAIHQSPRTSIHNMP